MKKIGIFYAAKADKTSWVAEKTQKEFGASVESVAIENAWQNDFEAYDNFIVGVSTWFGGELPIYWDELPPELHTLQLKGKKVAIFGLGDQVKYPENSTDGTGIPAEVFENDGVALAGFTSIDGYSFERSRSLWGEKWCGLVIDIENQSEMTDKRIKDQCKRVKKEFENQQGPFKSNKELYSEVSYANPTNSFDGYKVRISVGFASIVMFPALLDD